MDVEKTIANLQLRRFQVRRFATGTEAAAYLAEAVRGKTVGIGGCKTVDQMQERVKANTGLSNQTELLVLIV